MPEGPWEMVHIDFYGPLPTGEYLLVAIDRYSRYPEVEVVRSTKASTVIPKLDQMFARHGIQTIIKSDNGPPFNGTDYKHYMEVLGIKAKYSTPKWPQGNAEVKRYYTEQCLIHPQMYPQQNCYSIAQYEENVRY
jgi:transposase InsO family protein